MTILAVIAINADSYHKVFLAAEGMIENKVSRIEFF